MFLENSRYFKVPTVETTGREGHPITAIKLRPLPAPPGEPHIVKESDQLDVLAHQQYADGNRVLAHRRCKLRAAGWGPRGRDGRNDHQAKIVARMHDLSFRVYFGETAATVEDLAHIEEITIEQSEDAAWEARLVMALCLDDHGNWERQGDIALHPRTQVRVELKIGPDEFKPLIEGPIVGVDTAMDSRPGRSTATVTIHDDSAWLNMASRPISTEGRTDEEIARDLFTKLPPGATISPLTPQIEIPAAASPPSLGSQFAQLGTPMQKLRHLAQRNGCRAYVLPGEKRGKSIGCFKADPEGEPSLPALVLLGAGRNLADVRATEDPESSAQTEIHTLRLGDQQVVSYTTQAFRCSLARQRSRRTRASDANCFP
jgi:hypothetical protein